MTARPAVRVDRLGLLLVVTSSAAFGANAIFAKLAYADGATIGEFLSLRFGLAAAVFWLLLRPRPTRTELRGGLALGLAYCGQAGFYFTAVSVQDASVTSVFTAITPAVVAVGAVLSGREPARPMIFAGVLGAGVGVGLVGLGGGHGGGEVSGLGVALSIGSAVWYAGYLLVGDRVVSAADPRVLGCLIATGGAFGFAIGSVLLRQWRFDLAHRAWVWIGASALLSTVFAVSAVMAGMKRIGPSLTGMLTSTEVVATTSYTFVIFGERFSPLQLAGAVLVTVAVLAVQLVARGSTPTISAGAPEPVVGLEVPGPGG
jgi:drug/metabolite transporter (DMT)-like permease